jgi:acyl-CoA synthetase (AMP-forming)/AMP-acid ligase II
MFVDLRPGCLIEPLTGRRWSPAEVIARVRQRMETLVTAPSDRVFLHYGNTPEFFIDLLAVWNLGGCAIPVDGRLTPFEVETLAQSARPRFSVWSDSPADTLVSALRQLGSVAVEAPADTESDPGVAVPSGASSPVVLDQEALILFTSGTTGQPKGVVHTHRSLRAQWMGLRQSLGITRFRRTLCLLPTHFGHGLICNSRHPTETWSTIGRA